MIQIKNENLPEIVNIQLSAELLSELESIKADASSDFGKAHKDGVEISGNIYEKFRGVITYWRKYHYRWDGQKKEIATGLNAEEAHQGGYRLGADIFVKSGKWRVTFSLPQSGYRRFADYTEYLGRNGAVPHQVVTEMGSSIVNFKPGAQPVLTFAPVEPAGSPDSGEIIDAEFTQESPGKAQPSPSPSAQAANPNNPWT